MELVLYALNRLGGIPLVIFFHAVTITAGYVLLLAFSTRTYGIRIGVLATLAGAGLGIQNWSVRPQTISFLAFGLLVYLIEAHRRAATPRARRVIWWVAPLFALWVNAHGAFVFGVLVLGLYVIGQWWDTLSRPMRESSARAWTGPSQAFVANRRRLVELAGAGLAALAALTLNPQGPLGIARYVLGFLQSKATVDLNMEFAPLTMRSGDGVLFVASALLLVAALVHSKKRLPTDQILGLVSLAALSLFTRRVIPWYGLIYIPALAALLHGWWTKPRPVPGGRTQLELHHLGLPRAKSDPVGALVATPVAVARSICRRCSAPPRLSRPRIFCAGPCPPGSSSQFRSRVSGRNPASLWGALWESSGPKAINSRPLPRTRSTAAPNCPSFSIPASSCSPWSSGMTIRL